MTLVVGLTNGKNVWMGADSGAYQMSSGLTSIRLEPKVFEFGDYLFGFAGSFRFGQLIRHAFIPPRRGRDESIEQYMSTTFVAAMQESLKTHGLATEDAEVSTGKDQSCLLIGVGGRLFEMGADFSMGESPDGYVATGIAEDIALGALAMTAALPPERRILAVLKTGARHNAFVRAPFVMVTNAPKKAAKKTAKRSA